MARKTESKPRARRGGRPPKVGNRDRAVVCQVIVATATRMGGCGKILSNPKQVNIHLLRQHGLHGPEKAREAAAMQPACPFVVENGVRKPVRDHSWKLMPDTDWMWWWCLACGAHEESTQPESQAWKDDMDADSFDLDDVFDDEDAEV